MDDIGERPNKKNIKSLDLTRKVNILTFKALTWKRNSKLVLFFTRLLRGGESQAYKIIPVLCLFELCFLAATTTLFKTNEKNKYSS